MGVNQAVNFFRESVQPFLFAEETPSAAGSPPGCTTLGVGCEAVTFLVNPSGRVRRLCHCCPALVAVNRPARCPVTRVPGPPDFSSWSTAEERC